ncbi:hypothetical protein XENOCAPTIV_022016 [Xenoophorus captivus]|uniref:Piwi domain-containing protein n=1 Tax=Xenoophorus captivus TaxID=1517983 RepID=A0ABV0QE10_9TELE
MCGGPHLKPTSGAHDRSDEDCTADGLQNWRRAVECGDPCALKDYLKFNKCLPSRIIVYRDGVGDGQLHSIVNYEVTQMMDSIKSMGLDYE